MTVYDIAERLPPIDALRERCRALAVLERLVDGGEPYYAYTTAWGDDEAALMRNGSGDEYSVVFTAAGAFIRVFAHESPLSPYRDRDRDHELWPGLLDGLPAEFAAQPDEPAFADEHGEFLATAVLWRRVGDDRWHAGDTIAFPLRRGPHDTDPDGAGLLEILLDDVAARYLAFAADYYEVDLDRAAVEHVVAHRPLTDAVVRALNPGATLAELRADLTAIGYPLAAP